MKNNRKGFTLIELVIVVVIIGVLALMVLPKFGEVTHDAKLQTYNSNCRVAAEALAMYQAAHAGEVPTTAVAAGDDSDDLDPYINGGFGSLSTDEYEISYDDGVISGVFNCGKDCAAHAYSYAGK